MKIFNSQICNHLVRLYWWPRIALYFCYHQLLSDGHFSKGVLSSLFQERKVGRRREEYLKSMFQRQRDLRLPQCGRGGNRAIPCLPAVRMHLNSKGTTEQRVMEAWEKENVLWWFFYWWSSFAWLSQLKVLWDSVFDSQRERETCCRCSTFWSIFNSRQH